MVDHRSASFVSGFARSLDAADTRRFTWPPCHMGDLTHAMEIVAFAFDEAGGHSLVDDCAAATVSVSSRMIQDLGLEDEAEDSAGALLRSVVDSAVHRSATLARDRFLLWVQTHMRVSVDMPVMLRLDVDGLDALAPPRIQAALVEALEKGHGEGLHMALVPRLTQPALVARLSVRMSLEWMYFTAAYDEAHQTALRRVATLGVGPSFPPISEDGVRWWWDSFVQQCSPDAEHHETLIENVAELVVEDLVDFAALNSHKLSIMQSSEAKMMRAMREAAQRMVRSTLGVLMGKVAATGVGSICSEVASMRLFMRRALQEYRTVQPHGHEEAVQLAKECGLTSIGSGRGMDKIRLWGSTAEVPPAIQRMVKQATDRCAMRIILLLEAARVDAACLVLKRGRRCEWPPTCDEAVEAWAGIVEELEKWQVAAHRHELMQATVEELSSIVGEKEESVRAFRLKYKGNAFTLTHSSKLARFADRLVDGLVGGVVEWFTGLVGGIASTVHVTSDRPTVGTIAWMWGNDISHASWEGAPPPRLQEWDVHCYLWEDTEHVEVDTEVVVLDAAIYDEPESPQAVLDLSVPHVVEEEAAGEMPMITTELGQEATGYGSDVGHTWFSRAVHTLGGGAGSEVQEGGGRLCSDISISTRDARLCENPMAGWGSSVTTREPGPATQLMDFMPTAQGARESVARATRLCMEPGETGQTRPGISQGDRRTQL